MATTVKRIDGDYSIKTLNSSDSFAIESSNVNITGNISVSGNIDGNIIGNITGNVTAPGNTTELVFNNAGNLAASANLRFVSASSTLLLIGSAQLTNATVATANISTLNVSGDSYMSGNLTVEGNVTYINVETLSVEDPIIALGRGANNTPLVSNDGKDRGEQLWYYNASEKSAFIGFDNSAGKLIAAVDVSVASDVVTVASYGNFVVGNLEASIGSVSGNITAANLITAGLMTATGNIDSGANVTAGNVISSGLIQGANVSAVFNFSTLGNVNTGNINTTSIITAAGNITGGNLRTAGVVTATGNITGGNVLTGGLITATANITGGNLLTAGLISATGNITGGNILGGANVNATTHTGTTVSVTANIDGGNLRTAGVVTATGNIIGGNIITAGILSATGNANVGNLGAVGVYATNLSATGNANVGNLGTVGVISATGNIIGGNIITSGIVSSAGNVTFGNILVSGLISTTGNIVAAGNVLVVGNIVGNISGNLITAGGNKEVQYVWNAFACASPNFTFDQATNILSVNGNVATANVMANGLASVTGNITGGNIITAGLITSTGNISGNFFLGNGSQLTGLDATQIQNGTSNVKIVSSGGNITASVGGTSNVLVLANTGSYTTGLASVSGNITGGNLITGGLATISGNITGGNLLTSGLISATANITGGNLITGGLATISGNVTGGNLLTSGLISATGNITGGNVLGGANVNATTHTGTTVSVSGNITGGNILTGGIASVAGNITGGNLSVSTGSVTLGSIVNANGNGVGNIGSSSLYFNTIFAMATSAQYADLAEYYASDAVYEYGTVVKFGGSQEVTVSDQDHDTAVAGVVSQRPAFVMNAGIVGTAVPIALAGRVHCKVIGKINKGQMLVSAGNGVARAETDPKNGAIIGKSLENFDGHQGVIEIVVIPS